MITLEVTVRDKNNNNSKRLKLKKKHTHTHTQDVMTIRQCLGSNFPQKPEFNPSVMLVIAKGLLPASCGF